MERTFKSVKAEASEYGITVRDDGIYTKFIDSAGTVLAWMARGEGEWVGFTCNPEITGKKRGGKGDVADWCLDWAVNGF